MNIGIVGLGKLGTPVAVAIANKGHTVYGWDMDPDRRSGAPWPFQEAGCEGRSFEEWRASADLRFTGIAGIVSGCEIIFVTVQTPHAPRYEGITRLPKERVDFNYSHLEGAVADLCLACEGLAVRRTIAVVSTVLPGTIRRLFPADMHAQIVYNPQFLAMGDAVHDFLHPEFVLLGTRDGRVNASMDCLYGTLTDAPVLVCNYETAEAIKVLYNTYITGKIAWANNAMELCHRVGANVDQVTRAMGLATRRVTSAMYMRGGMGDGGPCHPRDNIALSWLARELGMRFDWFEALMTARERQAEFLCGLVSNFCRRRGLAPFVLGTAFKAGTNLEIGSAALLCRSILEEEWDFVPSYDPFVDGPATGNAEHKITPHVFLVGSNHPEFAGYAFPAGSVVIDPWRYVPDQEDVTVVRVGE